MRSLLLPHIHPVLNIISNFYIFQDCHSILFKINSSDPFALPLQLWPSKTSLILALQLLKTRVSIRTQNWNANIVRTSGVSANE